MFGHHQEECLDARLIKQGGRRQAPEKQEFIDQAVSKLREVWAIHGDCRLARPTNLISVPEKGGKVRMCFDFLGLNRVCSEDLFWPSRVGWSGGAPCNYICMPFGLLNVGATYQRFVQLALVSHEARCLALASHEAPAPREPPETLESPDS